KRPRSGFCANGNPSHCGPPTAPNSTASAFLALAIVSSGSGRPVFSKAVPPIRPSSSVYAKLRLRPYQESTRSVASITSGPMPSPGVRRMACMGISSEPRSNPGRVLLVAFFVGRDLVLVTQGQADIVPAIQEALAAEFVDLELHHATIGTADLLLFQIDGNAGIGAA